jgi:hypothetical protein
VCGSKFNAPDTRSVFFNCVQKESLAIAAPAMPCIMHSEMKKGFDRQFMQISLYQFKKIYNCLDIFGPVMFKHFYSLISLYYTLEIQNGMRENQDKDKELPSEATLCDQTIRLTSDLCHFIHER